MVPCQNRKKILIVDDEPQIVDVLERYLTDDGFDVVRAHDGGTAVATAESEKPDLLILDLKLPVMSGLDVFKLIRSTSSLPTIMLTSRVDEVDRIVGLELGADDYITKPFSPREVVARVHAVLRRVAVLEVAKAAPQASTPISSAPILIGSLEINTAEHEARVDGRTVSLTPTEFKLLETLAANAGRTFTRNQLLDRIKGDDLEIYDRTLDRHVANLRHKIEQDPGNPRYLVTVFGVGYKMRKNP